MLCELMFANFHLKDFMLLEFYILRLLVLKNFIMLEALQEKLELVTNF